MHEGALQAPPSAQMANSVDTKSSLGDARKATRLPLSDSPPGDNVSAILPVLAAISPYVHDLPVASTLVASFPLLRLSVRHQTLDNAGHG